MKTAAGIWDDPKAFRQRVRMVAAQVDGLGAEELARALAYELEPVSGVPADEAEVVWRAADEPDAAFRSFETAVVRRTRRRGVGDFGARALKPLGVLGLLLVAAAVADGVWLRHARTVREEEVRRRQPLENRLQDLRRRTAAADAARTAAETARAAAETAQRACAELRAAFPAMMDAIAGSFGGRAVVKALEPTGPFAVRVRAVAADAATAADVMVAMTRALAEKGWTLEPGPVQAEPGGAVVAFACEVRREGGAR